MQIMVNGKVKELSGAVTIQDFLSQKDIACDRIVVERNRDIVKRELWATTHLCDGDHLEIVQFVGGG